MEHESDGDTNYKWCARNGLQSLEELEIETIQIIALVRIEKSRGDLKRLNVIHTPESVLQHKTHKIL